MTLPISDDMLRKAMNRYNQALEESDVLGWLLNERNYFIVIITNMMLDMEIKRYTFTMEEYEEASKYILTRIVSEDMKSVILELKENPTPDPTKLTE